MTHEQKVFIIKEYNFLSESAKKFFNDKDLENLNIERVRLGVFVNTIEKLFNIDFYEWIEENAIPNKNNRG